MRVWVPPSMRQSTGDVAALILHAPDGHALPLSRIATVDRLIGQPEIAKENLKRMIAVTARLDNRDLGSVIADTKVMLDAPGVIPSGASYELGGLYDQQQIAFKGLLVVFVAAAALVFVLLLFLYESFAKAAAILLTSLLAVSAVFIGLWVTHIELNITAMMGMTMIIGIVTEVGIFYFSEQDELARHKDLDRSLVQAGQNRMRPIAHDDRRRDSDPVATGIRDRCRFRDAAASGDRDHLGARRAVAARVGCHAGVLSPAGWQPAPFAHASGFERECSERSQRLIDAWRAG